MLIGRKNIDKDVVEELIFGDSDAKYHSDAVRKLFSEVPNEDKVVPVGDVTDSTRVEDDRRRIGERLRTRELLTARNRNNEPQVPHACKSL